VAPTTTHFIASINAMAAPVEDKLFFCGEVRSRGNSQSHTHKGTVTENNGTVHGAYLSGIRAAQEVLGEVETGEVQSQVPTAKL
jgi:hypothetical protein